jgi:hypothetical protein
MKTLTDDEQALLENLIGYWLDHADRRNASTHPQSAEYWKAQDLARVALLRKLRGLAQIAGDFAESYQWANTRAAAAEAERDRARLCLLGVATSLGMEPDTQDEESVSASWSRLMEQIDSHFQTGMQPKEQSHERP